MVWAEKSGFEILPCCPRVMEQGKLARGCQYRDKWFSAGNIRRNVVGSEVTDNRSCQNLPQAPRLAAKVDCLEINPIAIKGLSCLKDQLQSHSEEEVRSL